MSDVKNKSIQATLTVTRKTLVTPNYMRVFLTGDNMSQFVGPTVGVNNKILIPPQGLNKICFPSFDYGKMEWIHPPEDVRPVIRTYTHRGIDLERNEIWIDFALHGSSSPASGWAIRAQTGDVLGVLMHNEKSVLYTPAENYVLVADASGLPVIAAILEDLPPTAKGICLLEVNSVEDEQTLVTQADIRFTWLHNPTPQVGSELFYHLKKEKLPDISRFGYVAAEFSTVKHIRSFIRKELNWRREELYAYSYWKAGMSEDKSTKDRHQEKETRY
ncbi:siderophore-interacting protein [Chitinophaga sp. Hz27]|uniref:siderophore-interacting protein n=1 Tax=Chitinophaga sp. Hz27 TaxID=3347169 RepID=UPI0035DE0AB3